VAASMFENCDHIGPYVIVRRIGEGGMGEVYQGRHRHIAREAAIKVLRPELSENEQVVKRFFTEARATATIRHPGIVEILDCDVHPSGRAYIVMEYLQGEDLAHRMARLGGFQRDLPTLLSVARQIASALAAAHGLGIVHRDLKPENIFLVDGATPLVKVLDFGVAKLLYGDGDARDKTRAGSVLGTPTYMAPEQCRGAGDIDHRVDIYALGCVLFEMVAGRPPFVRDGAGEVLVAHLTQAAPRLSSVVPATPPLVDELVANMLAKAPDARPQTMNQVLARLDGGVELRQDQPSGRIATQIMPTVDASPPERSGPRPGGFVAGGTQVMPSVNNTTLGDTASELETVDLPPRALRRQWVIPAAVAGVVVVVAGLVVVMVRPPHPTTPSTAPPALALPAVTEPRPLPAPAVAKSADVTIRISTQPPGAEVWVADESAPRGRTPLEIKLRRDAPSLRATLRAEDYASLTVFLDPNDPKPTTVVLTKNTPPPPRTEEPHHHHKHKAEVEEFKPVGD
jgi:serine/threonine protein kinase